jgi:2-dehydro-3-deoxyphosphogluconate aldolase/(4S)-4-hydroxy-2-oxoglutarate aldolase
LHPSKLNSDASQNVVAHAILVHAGLYRPVQSIQSANLSNLCMLAKTTFPMTIEKLLNARLVAIVRLDDLSQGPRIAETLFEAGVQAIEFTLTNSDSPKLVSSLRKQHTGVLAGDNVIGLGSVRTLNEAKIAVECGAQFVVCPITSVPIIEYCKRNHVAVCPGAYTPTEIATAWEAGADLVKVFPARSLGPMFIRDVLAPMPYLKLMPTGGVDLDNVHAYWSAGAAAVGIGSQLLNTNAIRSHDWEAIRSTAENYVRACQPNNT